MFSSDSWPLCINRIEDGWPRLSFIRGPFLFLRPAVPSRTLSSLHLCLTHTAFCGVRPRPPSFNAGCFPDQKTCVRLSLCNENPTAASERRPQGRGFGSVWRVRKSQPGRGDCKYTKNGNEWPARVLLLCAPLSAHLSSLSSHHHAMAASVAMDVFLLAARRTARARLVTVATAFTTAVDLDPVTFTRNAVTLTGTACRG